MRRFPRDKAEQARGLFEEYTEISNVARVLTDVQFDCCSRGNWSRRESVWLRWARSRGTVGASVIGRRRAARFLVHSKLSPGKTAVTWCCHMEAARTMKLLRQVKQSVVSAMSATVPSTNRAKITIVHDYLTQRGGAGEDGAGNAPRVARGANLHLPV